METVTPTVNVETAGLIAGLIAAFCAFAVVLWLRPALSRRGAVILGAAWLVLWNAEFFMLGPFSFVHYFDEGMGGFPLLMYGADHLQGSFAHAVGGGRDARLMPGGAQFFFLERFFMAWLPSWLALATHKAVLSSVALIGSYLVLRRGCGADRIIALGLAAFVTLGSRYFFMVTFVLGVMHGLIPLLTYIIGLRADRASSNIKYLLSVFPVAVLGAISGSPPHNLPVALFTVLLVSFMTGVRRWDRIFAGMALLVATVLANASAHLYFLWQYAPLSSRTQADQDVTDSLGEFWRDAFEFLPDESGVPVLWFAVIAVVALFLLRDNWRWRAGLALAASIFLGPVFNALPWAAIGLSPLSAVSYRYLSYSIVLVCAVLAARALMALCTMLAERSAHRSARMIWIPAAVSVAIAFFPMAKVKLERTAYWLGIGGQGAFAGVSNLRNPDWKLPAKPFRVVTVPFRLPQNYAPAYGFEAFDGYSMLPLAAWVEYWKVGIGMPDNFYHAANAAIGHGRNPNYWRCCATYDIADQVDLDLLRVANVRYVFSMVPLHGTGIRKVSGPPDSGVIARANAPFAVKLRDYIARNFDPGDAFVYEIDQPLPRMFPVTAIHTTTLGARDPAYYRFVAANALAGSAVVQGKNNRLRARPKSLRVLGYRQVPDGYVAELAAPDGGTVVLNVVHSPYWRVTADDRTELKPYPANAIHMAVDVPPGSRKIVFLYRAEGLLQ